jgi:hypothetical protein
MTHLKTKGLIFCSLVALFAAGQVFAHTGVRDTAAEGAGSYNAFTITHGCGGETGTQSYPVIGQSAVFPFGANAVWRDQAGVMIQVGGNGNGTISSATLALSVAGIEGGSPFKTYREIVDNLGNVQGLLWADGVMPPNMYALTQFRVTAPTISNPCVGNLKVRIGVINYCDLGKNASNDGKGPYKAPRDANDKEVIRTTSAAGGNVQVNSADADTFKDFAQRGNGDNNRADWWFTAPEGGSSLYNDPQLLQPTYWTTLTVKNTNAATATSIPTLSTCPGGALVDYSVEPSGVAFDTYLTGRNTRPFTKGGQGL